MTCKKLDKKLTGQVMRSLPKEILKPAPSWYSTLIDLFGPFTIQSCIFGPCARLQHKKISYGVAKIYLTQRISDKDLFRQRHATCRSKSGT